MSDFPAIQNQYRYPGQYPANPYDGVQVDPTAPPPVGTPAPSVPFYNPWNSAPTYAPPTGVPIAGNSPVGAAPDATQPPSIRSGGKSALDLMNEITAYLGDKIQGGDVKSLYTEIDRLNDVAAKGPSPLSLQVKDMLTQAKSANDLADFMKNNPQAVPELQHAQNVNPLQLPEVPQYVQPTANPVASLGAGIAGLFAPRAAGAFGAAALQGAITANDKLNAAKKQQYQLEFQQSLVKHEDDVRAADAQARIDAQNAAVKNAYSAEEHADNMKQAVLRADASQKEGSAGNLKDFITGSAAADAAKAQRDQLTERVKQAESLRLQSVKTFADVAGTIGQLNTERDKLNQNADQYRQDREAAQQKLQADLNQRIADRDSREKIASNRNVLDANLGALNDDRIRYGYNLEHSDRVAKLEQDAINSGSVLKDPKTYETMAAQAMMDTAADRLKEATKQLNAPSINNPNFKTSYKDRDEEKAYTHKRQLEVDYAQKQFDVARSQFLQAGGAARARLQQELKGVNTSPSTKTKVGGAGADPFGLLGGR